MSSYDPQAAKEFFEGITEWTLKERLTVIANISAVAPLFSTSQSLYRMHSEIYVLATQSAVFLNENKQQFYRYFRPFEENLPADQP